MTWYCTNCLASGDGTLPPPSCPFCGRTTIEPGRIDMTADPTTEPAEIPVTETPAAEPPATPEPAEAQPAAVTLAEPGYHGGLLGELTAHIRDVAARYGPLSEVVDWLHQKGL